MPKTDLSTYSNDWYQPGPAWKRILWYLVNIFFFQNPMNPSSSLKVGLLKVFGSQIGKGVVIKPGVNIKYPWKLSIGNHCWIGEKVWIDNLAQVTLENNVCLSQGSHLICGNHNYNNTTFDLMTSPITLEDGVWIGAKSVVCPGVVCKSHSILSVGSVATADMEPYFVYQGNPAKKTKERKILE